MPDPRGHQGHHAHDAPGPTQLARPWLLGGAVVLVAAGLFLALAQAVMRGQLDHADLVFAAAVQRLRTDGLTQLMLLVTHLHDTTAIAIYGALASVALWLRRRWREGLSVFATVGGALALNVALKMHFQRPRPAADNALLQLETFSFPSGHVLGTTVLYGLLLAWAWRASRRPVHRVAAAMLATMMVGLVAVSRVYVGVHYLSDTVAGVLEGVAWLALCLVLMPALRDPWRTGLR